MPPNRVNDASEDASIPENVEQEQEPEVTAEEAWAAAEGYTPLANTRTDGAVFMAFPSSDDNDDHEGNVFSGAFFADMTAFGPGDEWDDEDSNDDENEGETNHTTTDTEFRSVADQALEALDQEYSMALGGVIAPLASDYDGGSALSDAKLPAAGMTLPLPNKSDEQDDGLSLFKEINTSIPPKETTPIDTNAVRKAVAAIRLKAPRLTDDLNKWEEEHGVTNTCQVALAPRQHAVIPKAPLSAFWRTSPKAISATANLSRSATLAEAIQRLDCLDNKSAKERLVLHIVGADHVECSSDDQLRTTFGPLVRWIGALENAPQHFDIYLIGPNVPTEAAKRPPLNLMPTKKVASSRLVSATATCHEGVYHEWLQQQESDIASPDVAIAFNSGIWGYNEWLTTLKALCESSTTTFPFVSTAYTIQECEDDADVIEKVVSSSTEESDAPLQQHLLWKAEPNPFASRQSRETATAAAGREYRENAAWQAWRLGGGTND